MGGGMRLARRHFWNKLELVARNAMGATRGGGAAKEGKGKAKEGKPIQT